MKVYVLTAGNYSDYHIVAVFTERWKAERVMDILYGGQEWLYSPRIEEYDSDVIDDNRMQWEYSVWIDDNGNSSDDVWVAHDYEMAMTSEQLNKVEIMRNRNPRRYYVKVLAADRETALKIGRDLVAEFRAREEGVG